MNIGFGIILYFCSRYSASFILFIVCHPIMAMHPMAVKVPVFVLICVVIMVIISAAIARSPMFFPVVMCLCASMAAIFLFMVSSIIF